MEFGWVLALWLLAATSRAERSQENQTTVAGKFPNYQHDQGKVKSATSGEMLVLSNPSKMNLDEILKEKLITVDSSILEKKGEKDDENWMTLTDEEQKSLRRLLETVATSTELPKQPMSQLISTLEILMKKMVRLEARFTNQTKQTTSVMREVVELRTKYNLLVSGLKSMKDDLANLTTSKENSAEKAMQMTQSLQSQFNKVTDAQKNENELIRKEIETLGKKGDVGKFAQQMEEIKSDIDERLAGLVQQGKGKKSCHLLDKQAAMLYAMWQKLYKTSELGIVKVVRATSSSVGWNGVPSRAVDGNKSPRYYAGGCMHTNKEVKPWLLLKLQGVSNITGVEITNRRDCCYKRLSNFVIEGYMSNPITSQNAKATECYHYEGTVGRGATELIKCKSPVQALYVKVTIVQKTNAILTICEAVVKGQPLGLLSGKPTLQSSVTSVETNSDRANDGDKNTCSQTMADSVDSALWWQVDMRQTVAVHAVYIRNRNDDQFVWLRNITVTVHRKFPSVCPEVTSNLCTTYPGTVGKDQVVTLTCNKPITGRYLQISRGGSKDGGALSLCEVSVNDKNLVFG